MTQCCCVCQENRPPDTQTVKEAHGERVAYEIIEETEIKQSFAMGQRIQKSAKMPGFKTFFISLWRPLSKKMFGPTKGFNNVFYSKEKHAYRMDITGVCHGDGSLDTSVSCAIIALR